MEFYAAVRRSVYVEGLSERAAARRFGLARETVRKMLRYRLLRLPRSRGQVKAFGSRHGVYINIDSCGRCGSRAQRGIQRTCGRP